MKTQLKNLVLALTLILSGLVFSSNISGESDNSELSAVKKSFLMETKASEDSSVVDVISFAGVGGSVIQIKRYSKSIKAKPVLKGGEMLLEKEDKRLFIAFPQPDGSIIEKEILFADSIDKINLKKPVRLAATVNMPLNGLPLVDGIQVADKDEILLFNQTNPIENGVWVVSAGAWTRRKDSTGQAESQDSAVVYVKEGAQWADTEFNQITDNPVNDSSAMLWTPRSSQNVDGGDVDLLP